MITNSLSNSDRDPTSTAIALERWAKQRTDCAPLARALGQAAAAEAQGHACAMLDAREFDAVRAHPWVGNGAALTPAVLTEHGEFYLWRNWQHEAQIAAALRARMSAGRAAPSAADQADLARLFVNVETLKGQLQRAAVAGVVGQRLFVLSGGPGTGKTTTVLRMLLLLQRIAQRTTGMLAIALAAPTGKAAQRLSQSLRDGASAMRFALGLAGGTAQQSASEQQDLADWESALASLPESASTLHRLLGARPQDDQFSHDANSPLPFDLVVVDEASMVDLALMRALLDALRPTARLILIGDPDQLVSVSAGSVLADIVAAAENGPLRHQHVRLRHVWRTQGRLAEVYEAVRLGNAQLLQVLLAAELGATLHSVADRVALGRRLRAWLARPEWAQLDIVTQADANPMQAFAALRALQLLTALRGGYFGAQDINAWLDLQRRSRFGEASWYPGRPVMIRHNDYSRRLFNGDIGLTLRCGDQLRVCFESTTANGQIEYRYLLPRELPEHDVAYALTIHKSQGSEYGHVAVLLPPDADHRILSRQLLYTGVSRAKRSLEIWSSAASLATALASLSVRNGGLRRRLA